MLLNAKNHVLISVIPKYNNKKCLKKHHFHSNYLVILQMHYILLLINIKKRKNVSTCSANSAVHTGMPIFRCQESMVLLFKPRSVTICIWTIIISILSTPYISHRLSSGKRFYIFSFAWPWDRIVEEKENGAVFSTFCKAVLHNRRVLFYLVVPPRFVE